MSPPSTPADPTPTLQERLVSCSPERTLVARRRPGDDEELLVKIFERGSLREAQAEVELAGRIAQPGLVAYRQATSDPITNKPCVIMELCPGIDLTGRIAQRGPLAQEDAARITLQVAQVLAAMHQRSLPQAPDGVLHRDVKPSNIVVDFTSEEPKATLIDLEHACASPPPAAFNEPPSSVGFRGGTHGYAPPEAYLGARPTPAFDAFGVGATLHFILTGSNAFQGDDADSLSRAVREGTRRADVLTGVHPELSQLVEDCLLADHTRRPTLATIAKRLRRFLKEVTREDRELERVRRLARSARFDEARQALDLAASRESQTGQELRHLLTQLVRVDGRLGGMPHCDSALSLEPGDVGATASAIARVLPATVSFLQSFPCHAEARESCRRMQSAALGLLEAVPPQANKLRQQARFDQAVELLDATILAVSCALVVAGPSLPTVARRQGHLPSPLYRDPLRFLQRTIDGVHNLQRAHQKLLARLEQAEARLDLKQANQILDEITAIYSGASEVAAELKDRLHRLDFYLANIARKRSQLLQLSEQLEIAGHTLNLTAVAAFQQLCSERSLAAQDEGSRGKGGVAGLYRAIQDLVREFPHASKTARPALDALTDGMNAVTQLAWKLTEDARDKLNATPLPIRPIQMLLNRMDHLRLLKAFIDHDGHSREDLLEEIEWVRMRLDQARATRDQLARGAQESVQKGHLTTALYDMARAVDSFSGDAEADEAEGSSAAELRQQYENLKQRKEKLEQAAIDNHRLAAWYAELQSQDDSRLSDRVQALEQRAEALDLLLRHLDEERAGPYAKDLRDVRVQLMQEYADDGERCLDQAGDDSERLEIAQATMSRLRGALPESSTGDGGRARRMLEHWESHIRRSENAIQSERDSETRLAIAHKRSLLTRVGIVALLAVAVVGTYELSQKVFAGEDPMRALSHSLARTKLTSFKLTRIGPRLQYPRLAACVELRRFADRLVEADPNALNADVVASARDLVDELNQLAEAPADISPLDWVRRMRRKLRSYRSTVNRESPHLQASRDGQTVLSQLHRFGRFAHLAGIQMAAALPDAEAPVLARELRRQQDLAPLTLDSDQIENVLVALRR